MFVQSSYRWGDTTPVARGFAEASAPKNWTGFYVGGHLGGGWSDDRWSDPFGSAPSWLASVPVVVAKY
jgi:hypothetical protein